jgi:DNA polymerase-3 subunit beta
MLLATVEGFRIRDGIPWVSRLVSASAKIPVIQGILIETDGDDVCFSAYDLDTAGTATMPGIVRQPGRAVVSGRLLAAIAKVIDGKKDVSFIDSGSTLRITSGRDEWILPELDAGDFPILPTPPADWAKIDMGALRRAMRRVQPAAHRMITDPIRSTFRIISAGQTLRLIACDGFRAAAAVIDYEPPKIDSEIDIVVPTIFLDDGIAVLPSESAVGEFGTTPGAIALATPSQRLQGRLGAAEWPPIERLLPAFEPTVSMIFEVERLAGALARACVVVKDKPIEFAMSPDGFALDALTDGGSATAECPVDDYSGPSKKVGVNTDFLRRVLDTMESDRAILRTMPQGRAPLDFVPLDADGVPETDYRHLIMPTSLRK